MVLLSQKNPPYFCENSGKICSCCPCILQHLRMQHGAFGNLGTLCVGTHAKQALPIQWSAVALNSSASAHLMGYKPMLWKIFGMSSQPSCSQCLEYDTKGQVCTSGEMIWLCTAVIVCNDGQLQCNYLAAWVFFITFIADLWSLCPLSQVVPFHLHPRLAFSHLLSCPVLIILHQLAARCHC